VLYGKAFTSDISAVRKLWKEVFGDTDEYINRFTTRFGIENCYVCKKNNEIVAMSFAIPAVLSINEIQNSKSKIQNLKYLYACATHPDFQSQGIMAKLLETIYKDACNDNTTGFFLHAANDSLANYYRKLGFEDFFFFFYSFYYNHNKHKELHRSQLNFISPENYQKKRAQKLEKNCFINWNEVFFHFINETGTQFCEFTDTVFSFKKGINDLIVDELLGDLPNEQIANLLFEYLPEFEVVHIRTQGNEFCCGQIKWCNFTDNKPKKRWFAFAME
jgi:GNAT superfamily N-acetyltransferase